MHKKGACIIFCASIVSETPILLLWLHASCTRGKCNLCPVLSGSPCGMLHCMQQGLLQKALVQGRTVPWPVKNRPAALSWLKCCPCLYLHDGCIKFPGCLSGTAFQHCSYLHNAELKDDMRFALQHPAFKTISSLAKESRPDMLPATADASRL